MSNYKSIKALFLGSNIKSSIFQKYCFINNLQKNLQGYFWSDIKIKETNYNLFFKDLDPKEAPKKNKDIEEYLNNFDIIFLVYDNGANPIQSIRGIWKFLETVYSKLNTKYKILLGSERNSKILGFTIKKDPKKKSLENR